MLLVAGCLFIMLVISAYTDLAHHKVYNWVTIPGIIAGLLLSFASYGLQGLGESLVGLLVGGGLFLIFFLMGGMGGGDVKLMGAVGALGGYPFILWAIFYTALIGGLMGLVVLIWQGSLWKGLKQSFKISFGFLRPRRKKEPLAGELGRTVPYGIAIVLGTYCAWFLRGM